MAKWPTVSDSQYGHDSINEAERRGILTFIALAAFDTSCASGFGAVSCIMVVGPVCDVISIAGPPNHIMKRNIPAVSASVLGLAWLSAVTHTVSERATVDALDHDSLVLNALLPAGTATVAHSYLSQDQFLQLCHGVECLTSTVSALHDVAIIRLAGILQTLDVVGHIGRPALSEIHSKRPVAERESNHILAIQLALEVNQSDVILRFFLLDSKISVSRCPLQVKEYICWSLTRAMRYILKPSSRMRCSMSL